VTRKATSRTPLGEAAAHRLDLPALGVGIPVVAAGEFAREQRGLVAAGAGADLHHGVARVRRLRRDHRQEDGGPEHRGALLQRGDLRGRQLAQLRRTRGLAGQVGRLQQLPLHLQEGGVVVDQPPQLLLLARHLGRPPRVRIEGRLGHLGVELLQPTLERGNVGKGGHGSDLRIARAAG